MIHRRQDNAPNFAIKVVCCIGSAEIRLEILKRFRSLTKGLARKIACFGSLRIPHSMVTAC